RPFPSRRSSDLQLLGRAVAVVRLALGQKLLHVLVVNVQPLALEVRAVGAAHFGTLVPVNAEPFQILDDGPRRLLRGALQVRVLDAQDEGAAVMAGKQPVEQCRPRPADVQIAGRARRVPRPYGHARFASFFAMATTAASPSS